MWTVKTKEIPVIIGQLKLCLNLLGQTSLLCCIELESMSNIQSNTTKLMILLWCILALFLRHVSAVVMSHFQVDYFLSKVKHI